jgi:hypothetical protein
MPDGVMDYLEHGATPAEQAVAEAQAAAGGPRSYERALEHQRTRRPVVRQSGRPVMTMLAGALGLDERHAGGQTDAEMAREDRERDAR